MLTNTLTVSHIKQSSDTRCGAAALAMVLSFFGEATTELDIWKECKSRRPGTADEFILTKDLVNFAIKQGFFVFIGLANMKDSRVAINPIPHFLSLGLPIIVCQRVSECSMWGHFRVVIGIDGQNIIVNDPLLDQGSTKIGKQSFFKMWAPTVNNEVVGGQSIVVIPKQSIIDIKTLAPQFRDHAFLQKQI